MKNENPFRYQENMQDIKSEILGEVLDKTSKFNYENYTKNDILKALDTQIEP